MNVQSGNIAGRDDVPIQHVGSSFAALTKAKRRETTIARNVSDGCAVL
jgi:hypothetical protein